MTGSVTQIRKVGERYFLTAYMPNPSGILPTEFKVLVRPNEVAAVTKGGIHLPDESKERDQYAQIEAVLVAVSPLAFTYVERWPEGAAVPVVGDRVLVAKYAGTRVKGSDGVDYKLCSDRDIGAILE